MKRKNRLMLFDTSVLKDEKIFRKFYEKMSKERKKKIDAIKPEGSKRLCLGAGILLDRAVGPCEIILGPQGKPYAKDMAAFFNLSHSGDMAVIALSDSEVGVDIQKIKHFKDSLVDHVFNIEDKKLAEELLAELADTGLTADDVQHDDSSFDQVCTRMWAMKESVMKYTGKGLSLDPKKITLKLIRQENSAISMADDAGANTKTIIARIDSPEYDKKSLVIHEYDKAQYSPSSFFGISVCTEYEDFARGIDIVTL